MFGGGTKVSGSSFGVKRGSTVVSAIILGCSMLARLARYARIFGEGASGNQIQVQRVERGKYFSNNNAVKNHR